MIGMSQIYILVEYNGKWEQVDGGSWRWFGVGVSKGFVVDRSVKFLELEETIYDRTSIDRSLYAIEITHKPGGDIFCQTAAPTLISNDSDITDIMFLYNEKRGMVLHVIVKEKCGKGKALCVHGDDDLNSNGGDALGFHDDYFGCRINEEIPFVARFVPTELLSSYEHPLQICATSTPINEGYGALNPTPITGSNPTPEETVLEEVANEDDGRDKAGDDVLEGVDDVRKGCDGVPEEDDGIPGGGDGLHERVYDSRCQHSESEETRFVPLISYDSGRNDGSDLMVGQEVNQDIEGSCVCRSTKLLVAGASYENARVFDIDKIPCIHTIAAAGLHRPQHTGSYIYSLCSEYYTSDYWMLAYAETIYPVPPESQWHNIPEDVRAIKVVAPDVKMFRGRPRLIRFPSQGECIVKKYKCATCGQGGHNSKKCPNLAHPSDVRSST
ncbi:hypothetical protein TIFTF001_024032 [Ficus carica]|uniref:CCHC-type domain-containing protein n=1 Tax=Ficus carica TaxID=3494 RepID=A0AA88AVD2_FICCA|nr:hypothetical protein TIFTF001_024032 [Ficus carica]